MTLTPFSFVEYGLALVDEGVHAFALIGSAKHGVEQAPLDVQAFGE
jgi:hypothetical protein